MRLSYIMEMNVTMRVTRDKIKTQIGFDELNNRKSAVNSTANNKPFGNEVKCSPGFNLLNDIYAQCEKYRSYLFQKGNNFSERRLTEHLLGNNLRALSQADIAFNADVINSLKYIATEFEKVNNKSNNDINNLILAEGRTCIPDAKLWEMIADSINKIDENYMDVYEFAVKTYMDFYSDFSDAIGLMAAYINDNTDEKSQEEYPLNINCYCIFALFNDIYNKYNGESGVLYDSESEQDAMQWADEWGNTVVTKNPESGMYEVRIDLSPIEEIMGSIASLCWPDYAGDYTQMKLVVDWMEIQGIDLTDKDAVNQYLLFHTGEIFKNTGVIVVNTSFFSSATYQSFQAGFDAQEQIIQTSMQTLTQKYNTAVTLIDNLYKILSSTISSCAETLKSYLNF
ncbi:IpaD/SipD/SspD family type III secretion system needle tip protein [Citrobacter sp. wls826]|nr:IpaD/SipD/SspD family type III secretion system needle tip protein [Citrobacter sp. wls826]